VSVTFILIYVFLGIAFNYSSIDRVLSGCEECTDSETRNILDLYKAADLFWIPVLLLLIIAGVIGLPIFLWNTTTGVIKLILGK